MTTDPYQFLLMLTDAQVLALEALDTGATHQDAADAAGVHRTTVSVWNTSHPGFMAERRRRKAERAAIAGHRAAELTLQAFNVLSEALATTREPRLALDILRVSRAVPTVEPLDQTVDPVCIIEREVKARVRDPRVKLLDQLDGVEGERDRALAEYADEVELRIAEASDLS